MRAFVWTLLVLLTVSSATAEVTNILTEETFLTDFDFSKGVCTVQLEYTHDKAELTSTMGYWPLSSNEYCYDLEDTEFLYGKGSSDPTARVKITHTDNEALNPDEHAVFLGAQRGMVIAQNGSLMPAPELIIESVPPGQFDQYPPNGADFNFSTIVWCGEWLGPVIFDTNTLSPSEFAKLSYSTEQHCSNFYSRNGENLTITAGAYSTAKGLAKPFTLPLRRNCTYYEVTFTDGNSADWPLGNPQRMQKTTDGYEIKLKGEDDRTEAILNVTLDTNDRVAEISVLFDDGGPRGGSAAAVTFTCVEPQEPDETEALCDIALAKWDDDVNTAAPGFACCGDDGAADLGAHGSKICTYDDTANKYAWIDASTLCRYPPGWKIGTLDQQAIDDDAASTFLPLATAVAPDDCCSAQVNHGTRRRIAGQDEFLCSVLSDNRTRWIAASQTKDPVLFHLNATNTTYRLASDGVAFSTCRDHASIPGLSVVMPSARTAGLADPRCP